ncbi:hypothetical protein BGW80DRAFT_422916 [Lactifluus volemus]|nr:hypothetical protein BGW80DRAFT_422916 [Lactifluus volemus]
MGIMALGLLTVCESPRWLASQGRSGEALTNLAYLRKRTPNSEQLRHELAEIDAAIAEEREARTNLGLRQAILELVRTKLSQLLRPTDFHFLKFIATAMFIFFLVDTWGRKPSLFVSAIGMGTLFFIVGAVLKTHPPASMPQPNPPVSGKAMAAMIYIYVCFYSMGWGPLPWVYVSDIFPTRTRHHGLAVASSSQWLWNFVVSKITPTMHTKLGYKMFLLFASVNVGVMIPFSFLIPETKGRSLEEMDIVFGVISADDRAENIARQEREMRTGVDLEPVGEKGEGEMA